MHRSKCTEAETECSMPADLNSNQSLHSKNTVQILMLLHFNYNSFKIYNSF